MQQRNPNSVYMYILILHTVNVVVFELDVYVVDVVHSPEIYFPPHGLVKRG